MKPYQSKLKWHLFDDIFLAEPAINHKGTWCWMDRNVFCQEGWCKDCIVYDNYIKSFKEVVKHEEERNRS